jgi:4-carboxymuconolactone decarboxylase
MANLPDPTATLTAEARAIYEDILARRKARGVDRLGPYIPLLNHPDLARLIEQLGFYYKYEATLPRDVYQFIVLATAKRSGVAFEWADHIAAARDAGLPQAVIEAVADERNVPSPFDIVAQTMDCAFAYRSIPTGLQDQIVQRFGFKGLIEIVTLCGFYTLIGMVNAGFDVPLPPRGPSSA